jgi:hypothetical protein
MNNYGVVINEIGMRPMVDRLQREVLQPIAQLLFPRAAAQFDEHHAFTVQYQQGEDLGLDMHVSLGGSKPDSSPRGASDPTRVALAGSMASPLTDSTAHGLV